MLALINKISEVLMSENNVWDCVLVGAGQAGIIAAEIMSKKNKKTLIIVPNKETSIFSLACNVTYGGVGRSQLAATMNNLGIESMFNAIEHSITSIGIINQSKGPAMYSKHVVVDKEHLRQTATHMIKNLPNITIMEDMVDDIIVKDNKVYAVKTQKGEVIRTRSVILAAGTFLNGKLHTGMENSSGGRMGHAAAITLAARLKELNLPQGRLKTGTPPRLDGRTIDFSKLQAKWGDGAFDESIRPTFSVMGNASMHLKQLPCFITKTNQIAHDILRSGFDESPFIQKMFEGTGPRYCPSIEDKITRFKDKDSHQIILEPEGHGTYEYYPNGISTSLKKSVQLKFVNAIEGLEKAVITKYGYAVEFDYYKPHHFKRTMEFPEIENLFLASPTGVSGYLENAAISFVASINCALKLDGEAPWIPERHHSYIGVMLDDINTKELLEPYRMLTSLNEYRLSHRLDNMFELTPEGRKLGLVSDAQYDLYCKKQDAIASLQEKYKLTWLNSKNLSTAEAVEHIGSPLSHETNLASLIKRPEMNYEKITAMPSVQSLAPELSKSEVAKVHGEKLAQEIVEQVEISFKYEGYISRQQEEVKKMSAQNNIKLPSNFDYATITALSTEVKQKLNQFKPETIGQASRISGVTPSAISLLLIWLKKNKMLNMQTV